MGVAVPCEHHGGMSQVVREPRRAFRDPDDHLLGGVASGVGQHLGVEPMHARIGFIVLALLGGFGVLVYGALWVLLPVRDSTWFGPDSPGLEAASRRGARTSRPRDRRREIGVALSLCLVGGGGIVLLQNAGFWLSPRIFWPLLVAGSGVALLWWQADHSGDWIAGHGWRAWLRLLLGGFLLAMAVSLSLLQSGVAGAVDDVLGAIVLAVGGASLVVGPWLLRLTRDLRLERRERIRSQERADVAAHLHDSVLQTLALIQRQAGDPQRVTQLARTQERELRTWLFESTPTEGATLRSSLQRVVSEVEGSHQVPIELVVVGDAALDDPVSAIIKASREAILNAAKHSGAERIDVFAEVQPDAVEVGVRDRGRGFDPDNIAHDRRGVRGSIVDRLARHGGRADVRSSPGHGTDLRMTVPLRRQEGEA